VNGQALTASLSRLVADEFDARPFGERRLAFDTPLSYPNGESVVIFLTELDDGHVEITDYGEGYGLATARRGIKRGPIRAAAHEICAGLGLEFADGRVTTVAEPSGVPDVAWRVALASSRIAEAVTFARPEPRDDEGVFASEVESAMREREIPVERQPLLLGDSGHEYRPSLFIRTSDLIVEPIAPESAWLRAASVYTEFGDLSQANGYKLLAVFDDRAGQLEDKIERLLTQVGDVARWSRRDSWMRRIGPPPSQASSNQPAS
jgi:hypothetical protein